MVLVRPADYLPKHFASKKVGKELLIGGLGHSPLKLDGQLHSSRVEHAPKHNRSPFDQLPIDTRSNHSESESMEEGVATGRFGHHSKTVMFEEPLSNSQQ